MRKQSTVKRQTTVLLVLLIYAKMSKTTSFSRVQQKGALIEGEAGSTLMLPCDVTPPPGDRIAVILWYRDMRQQAVYTYDVRNTSFAYKQNTPLDPSLESRASFDPKPPAGLTIVNSMPEDGGFYQCRVDFVVSPSKTTNLKVRIVELPHAIHLEDETGAVITLTHDAKIGDHLKISCVVRGGDPPPKVWWTVNKTPEVGTTTTYNNDITRSEFFIDKLARKFHEVQFGCHASSTNSTSSIDDYFTLRLTMPPTNVFVTTEASHVQAGHRFRVFCDVKGAFPNVTVTWTITKTGRHTEIVKKATGKSRGRWWMEKTAFYTDDEAQIGCSASTPTLPHILVQNTTTLVVHFAPRLKLGLGKHMKPSEILEGLDVYFICSVKANPKVYKMKWFIADDEILQNSLAGIIVSDNHLVIQKVSRNWTGIYTCRASNVVGDSASNTLPVTVRFSPVCFDPAHSIYEAALGEEVLLPCKVEAYPTNATFYWTFSNSVTQKRLSQEWVTWDGLHSFLQYRPESLQDYGTLQCWAVNHAGQQKEPCVLSLRPAGAPSPPSNCSVSNQTWDTLAVICYPPKLGYRRYIPKELDLPLVDVERDRALGFGLKKEKLGTTNDILYLITVFERERMTVVHNQSNPTGAFLIRGLSSGLDYLITVSRFNNRGRSSEITLEALTLRAAENRMRNGGRVSLSSRSLGGWMATIIGGVVGSIIIIIAIAATLIVVVRRNSANNAIEQQSSKSTRIKGVGEPDLIERKNRFSGASSSASSYNLYSEREQDKNSSNSLKKSTSALFTPRRNNTDPSSPPSQLKAQDLQSHMQQIPCRTLSSSYNPSFSSISIARRDGSGGAEVESFLQKSNSRLLDTEKEKSLQNNDNQSSGDSDESDKLDFSYTRHSANFLMERESFL